MKEILKYLRQTNSFTQEEIAKRLEISRQSYIKYESGEIEPNDKIIRKLSIIYGVKEDFIRQNQIPNLKENKTLYNIKNEKDNLQIAEPAVLYSTNKIEERQYFEGYFDGTCVRILDSLENLNIKKGQKFRLFIENEEEEMQRRQAAFDKIMEITKKAKPCTLLPDEDPYYKEALYEALEEKYGAFN